MVNLKRYQIDDLHVMALKSICRPIRSILSAIRMVFYAVRSSAAAIWRAAGPVSAS